MRLIGEMGKARLGREGDGNREKTSSYLERKRGFALVGGGEPRSCEEDEWTEQREDAVVVDARWEDRRWRGQRRRVFTPTIACGAHFK